MGGLCGKAQAAVSTQDNHVKDFKPDPLLPGNDASASKGKSKGEKKMQDEIAAKVNAVVTGSTANISAKGNSADKKKDVDRKPGAGNELSPNANGDGDEPVLERQPSFRRDWFAPSCQGQIDNFYKMCETVGTGSYGAVSIVIEKKTNVKKACKTIQQSKVNSKERLKMEIDIMRRLDHPSIARLYETFQDKRNIYLIMELCSGGELFDKVIGAKDCHFTEKAAATVMRQIIAGVVYMHASNICHRDLKPENFLLQEKGDVAEVPLKIIDFGLSVDHSKVEWLKTKACTPYYVAPEVLTGKYRESCDVWSIGVIMYVLLCGAPPFFGDTDAEVLSSVRKGHYEFDLPVWEHVSKEAKDLVARMLVLDPKKRYTANDALNHKWIIHLAPQSKGALPFSAGAFRNLKKFRQNHRLKKAALTIVAHNIDEAQISDLRQMFLSMDKDSDGTLTIQEIKEGMAQARMRIPSDIDNMLRDIDSDGSGQIDYSEFLAATMEHKQYVQEELCWAAFRVFDLDGNGKITKDELATVLSGDGGDIKTAEQLMGIQKEEIESIIAEVDTDGDGEIDFEEFMAMIRNNSTTRQSTIATQPTQPHPTIGSDVDLPGSPSPGDLGVVL